MANQEGNYCAFYVKEPFSTSNLGANATKDFCYYNLLRAWNKDTKILDFNFIDSHDTTYNVRDGSDWEKTLKPRLHERLRNSKNIVLFLSSNTKYSQALKEEIDYGINTLKLPVIVIYPDYGTKASILTNRALKQEIKDLWDKLPIFRDSRDKVPVLHIPLAQDLVKKALNNKELMVATKRAPSDYFYS